LSPASALVIPRIPSSETPAHGATIRAKRHRRRERMHSDFNV
jgi:hypothetical protein